MVLEDLEHLKTLPVESGAYILEEEAYGPILKSSPKLLFPILAGKGVLYIRQQHLIRAGCGEAWGSMPENNLLIGFEFFF